MVAIHGYQVINLNEETIVDQSLSSQVTFSKVVSCIS